MKETTETAALDAEKTEMTDLEKHDAKYHPNGYKPGDSCKYREDRAKGDNVDKLDPENVDGEEIVGKKSGVEGEQRNYSSASKPAQDLADAKDEIDKALQGGSNLKDIGDKLDAYEKAYNAASGGAGVNALQGILGQVQAKSQNGIVAQIIAKRLAAAKAASASANLPKGTLTPQEMRNQAAMSIAKMLGANLTPPAAAPSGSAAATPQSTANSQTRQPEPPITPTTTVQPANQSMQFGPKAALDISAAGFPKASDFNFSTYGQSSAGWVGGTSGSTAPHSIVVNGQKYWVKQAGNNPSYSNAAAENEVNANKFVRLAGFNAPESKLYTENGVNYCVTKDTPFSGTAGASNSAAEMREAYPLMALLYSTDAMQNGNTKRDKNGMVFIDNGSSFGFSAQGNRPNPNLDFDYDSRTEPDSHVNDDEGILHLMDHPSQREWKNAFPVYNQAKVFQEAAKYEMGALVKEATKLGLLNHLPAKGVQSLQTYADNIDKLSAKYKTAGFQTVSQSSTGNTRAAPQTAQPAAATASGQQQASQPAQTQGAAQTGQVPNPVGPWQMPTGPVAYNPQNKQHAAIWNIANQSWKVPGANTPNNQLRNAQTILAAIAAGAGAPHSVLPFNANTALGGIVRRGTFVANGRGIGGTVTGVNLPRKGIQAVQKSINSILNPQGLRMQVHNNGNITFSATNRAIAKQALASAGMATGGGASSASPAAMPTPTSAPTPSGSAATTPQSTANSQGKAWQNHLSGLQAGPGATNQQLNNAYQGIANWLNAAGV